VLVMWESSRAQRNLSEYVEFRDLCAERGVMWSYKGRTYDPSTGEDRERTAYDAIRDESEAERTRDRVLRASKARATAGRPHSRMPYGYRRKINPDTGKNEGWVIDEFASAVVREAVERILKGHTLYSICSDFDSRGIQAPSKGGDQPVSPRWIPKRLKKMLLSPTYVGHRTYHGQVIGIGTWEPIVTEDEYARYKAILTNPDRTTTVHHGPVPKHLLSGIALCGVCGRVCRFYHPVSKATATYTCESNQRHVTRSAYPIDKLVTEVMISFLEDPRVIERLTKAQEPESQSGTLLAEITELRQRLDSFYDQAAEGSLSAAALARIEHRILPEIESLESQIWATVSNPRLANLSGPEARQRWEALPLVDQRAAIRSALVIRILPSPHRGRHAFDPSTVEVNWLE
jgi:site-specific DNA recombinase